MKKFRKLSSLAIGAVLVASLSITALAATPRTITIKNAVDGQKYNAYKVFDVTYNADKTSYNYSIDSRSAFYETVSAFAATAANGLTLTQVGTSTKYNLKVDKTKFDVDKATALAQALRDDNTKPEKAGEATASGTSATIDVDDIGYYFVDSSLGSLVALDTTDPSVEIFEKNSYPSLTKQVEEDDTAITIGTGSEAKSSTANTYGEIASADIGQTVNFKLTVNTGTNSVASPSNYTGVVNDYVIEDTLPAGMTFGSITSVKATPKSGTAATWTSGTEYTVSTSDQKITVTLKGDHVEPLQQDADIEIIYTASLNENAVIAQGGNTNTAALTYGTFKDEDHTATVYTFAMALEKYNSEGVNLADAVFTFPFTATQVQAGGETSPAIYKRTDTTTGTTDITTPKSGNIVIIGLDKGSYSITEKAAPEGYNPLPVAQSISVEETNTATVNKTFTTSKGASVTFTARTDDGAYQIAANSIAGIENESGAVLPSTGGVGTTIFYIIGSILVIGAGVLLVTKKRMDA